MTNSKVLTQVLTKEVQFPKKCRAGANSAQNALIFGVTERATRVAFRGTNFARVWVRLHHGLIAHELGSHGIISHQQCDKT